ncbi:mitochondrial ribosomal subunit protein-domain-containing protein [Lasiosphaeria hispida]|uniref:Mitochondrial ribosomal subunit protein-domain-containing protein n=1 Tax=Lasiosphaeria hispida TaxID=260671 RepID=A0AAJ0HGG8_9PEZI|nr:mitochondrial ribosomal subunit protein-domain-containing protein [Lasiosphaeria hispida]
MASAVNSLRLCLRTTRQLQCLRVAQLQPPRSRRTLSTTPIRWAEKDSAEDEGDEEQTKNYSDFGNALVDLQRDRKYTEEERKQFSQDLQLWEALTPAERDGMTARIKSIKAATAPLKRPATKKKNSFWNEEEHDTDLITNEVGEDDFEEDDIVSLGHGKLEEHREHREYARLAVWEMPLLSKFAKKFEPPTQDEVLRFRFTSYMGEFHPADRKVVVEFCPTDLKVLTEAQQLKLKKLAGSRYNPEKDLVRVSCERYEHQAQNKRYLGDLVDKMITMAKDPTDMFEDIPLDTRHHIFKAKPKFPVEWRMNEERRAELEDQRKKALLLDESKRMNGTLVDGVRSIQEAFVTFPEPVASLQPAAARKGTSRSGKSQARVMR